LLVSFAPTDAVVKTYSGEEIDIVLHIHQISIFEDLYSPFLTVELEIRDAIGLKHKVPFRGEEVITLTVTDADKKFGLQDASVLDLQAEGCRSGVGPLVRVPPVLHLHRSHWT
jgi:hypothetical protein